MDSKNPQATPSPDRMLGDAQLHAATLLSLPNAGSAPDVTRRGEEAVLTARTGDATTEPLQAEMQALLAVEGSLSDKNMADTRSSSRRAALPLCPASQPSSKRLQPAPEASDCALPDTVEPRCLVQSTESAVERFLGVPELVSQVFEHLIYDRIDLLSLCQVSKQCLSIALPMLMESLSIPFTDAETYSNLFNSHPGLIAQIKFLRLWDDVAEAKSDWAPVSTIDELGWTKLGDLLALFEDASVTSIPTLSLSIGQLQLFEVRTQFLRAPRLLARLVSLRIVDDVHRDPETSNVVVDNSRQKAASFRHSERMNEDLTDLLRDYFDRQAGTAYSLQRFAFHAARVASRGHGVSAAFPVFGPRLRQKLANTVRQLDLFARRAEPTDFTLESLLEADWHQLRSLRLVMSDQRIYRQNIYQAVQGLINRDTQLQHVHTAFEDAESALGPRRGPSELQHYSFSVEEISAPEPRQAKRQKVLRDLTLYLGHVGLGMAPDEVVDISSLRVIRGSFEAVKNILKGQHHLRMIFAHQSLAFDFKVPTQLYQHLLAPTVTFLWLEVIEPIFSPLNEDYPRPLELFPNLVEFVLLCKHWFHAVAVEENYPGNALNVCATLLSRLKAPVPHQRCKIRALRVKSWLAPLPVSADGFLSPSPSPPPSLEYVGWERWNDEPHVQHFRVLHGFGSTPESPRLQQLPKVFRPKVDRETGLWEDEYNARRGDTLYDHLSGEEPRLKYL
ncbi:hypothetical protein V8E36_009605 [Tilletia maclaganii]